MVKSFGCTHHLIVGDRGCDDIQWVEVVISAKLRMNPWNNQIPRVKRFGLNFIGLQKYINRR